MPTYISLIDYTDEGMKAIKESPRRLALARQYLKDIGGEMKAFYLTMGSHDAVVVFECPDNESAARFLLSVGGHRKVITHTLVAFPEASYERLLGALPETRDV